MPILADDRDGGCRGPLLTVKQAAERLGLTEWQVRHGIEQGHIPAVRVSEHRLRVRAADVESILDAHNPEPTVRLAQARLIREELEDIALRVRALTEKIRALEEEN